MRYPKLRKFKRRNTISTEEIKATKKVLDNGILSDYLAASQKKFFGGKYVKNFEKNLKSFFKVKHALTFNSWTSGLIAAVGALDLEPGNEIITSPFTMSATIFSIVHWNLVPIFADIDPNTFCLDPKSVEKKITKKTKAILLVDINGHPSDIKKFKIISKKYNLKLIIDAAQSIGAQYKKENRFAGTIGDIGGYSLNVHKHINTGEGGVIVTDDNQVAKKIALIRNHGENMIKISPQDQHFYGYNLRMGEIEAAIGIEQLKKLPKILRKIQMDAKILSNGLKRLKGLQVPFIESNCTHAFYNYPLIINLKELKVSRKVLAHLLRKEGVPISEGYQNIHLLPFFKNKTKKGITKHYWSKINLHKNYKKGSCPVAERLHEKTYMALPICYYEFSKKDLHKMILSFNKVWKNIIR